MINDATPDPAFLQLARAKRAMTEHPKSKLEPHRASILAAVSEGLPVTTIQAVLEEHCGLTVSYSNLRDWIRRQPEFRKTSRAAARKPMTKAEQARWDKFTARDPNEPLTLSSK